MNPVIGMTVEQKKLIATIVTMAICITLNAVPLMRIQLTSKQCFHDETVVYFQKGASPSFDKEYDAYKLFGPKPAPRLVQQQGRTLFSINGIPAGASYTTVLLCTTPQAGTFTLRATNLTELKPDICILLSDGLTGELIDLRKSAYTFFLDTSSASRFTLIVKQGHIPLHLTKHEASEKMILTAQSDWAEPLQFAWFDGGTCMRMTQRVRSDSISVQDQTTIRLFVSSTTAYCFRTDTILRVISRPKSEGTTGRGKSGKK